MQCRSEPMNRSHSVVFNQPLFGSKQTDHRYLNSGQPPAHARQFIIEKYL